MATEYISREAASDLLAMALIDDWEPEYAQDRLSEIPAADVRPVGRGKWIPETDRHYHWHCSECGYVIGTMRMDADFCLKCGADMRGDAECKET